MYKDRRPLFFTCETPLHAGSGADLGIVDLPIQRERHTSFPKIESSSLKGALREAIENHAVKQNANADALDNLIKINKIFGYDENPLRSDLDENLKAAFQSETKNQSSFAGAIGFTDARLLLFPVKSMKGVFAWITCPKVLLQFESDMKIAFDDHAFEITGIKGKLLDGAYTLSADNTTALKDKKLIILEEYAFKVHDTLDREDKQVSIKHNEEETALGEWLSTHLFNDTFGSYWKEKIKTDIVILPDDDFKDFVNLSTEVITRTKINNHTGTVEQGALFTEEYLPTESIMYNLVLAHDEFTEKNEQLTSKEVLAFFNKYLPAVVQIGGNATIGKGIVRVGKSFLNS
ncbi:MAG: type III-B CRISPR module RAMP protein Cmr4 [Chitinophagales bacterium]|nr:type III-B CRISPR module RAMP protein Cmr4 [Chitinophagales bacterium]